VLISEFGAVALDHLCSRRRSTTWSSCPTAAPAAPCARDWPIVLPAAAVAQAAGRAPFRRIVLETSGLADPAPTLYTLSADAFLEAALRLDRVVTTIDAVLGAPTLERYPEAVAQAAVADLLVVTKSDLAPIPDGLVEQLATLNPLAPIVDAGDAEASALLFGGAAKALPRPRPRVAVTHSHGIYSLSLRLQRPMTRLGFAMALGRLASDHGEKLLRVKGLVEFADRPDGPAAIHAVQHTLYPPRWLERWP
jgi:G3E family GTPase